jgi:hypothetical protein
MRPRVFRVLTARWMRFAAIPALAASGRPGRAADKAGDKTTKTIHYTVQDSGTGRSAARVQHRGSLDA